MKHRFCKFTAACLVLAMMAAIGTGCGTVKDKSEPTQSTIEQTPDITETTAPSKTPAQKAMAMYAELLESYPAILDKDEEILSDLSFGYEENLAKFGMHYDCFSVLDLNQDGIPELIANTVINNRWVTVSIFQYDAFKNELWLLKDPLDSAAHATFEQMSTAGGTYSLFVCKDNHLHNNWGGDTPVGFQEENHAYVLTEDGLAVVDCALSGFTGSAEDVSVIFGDVNNEQARSSVFDK